MIIVGYQALGTPGRALVDGARNFRVGGEEIAVRASIHTLGGFSAHAGQRQLLDWVAGFRKKKPRIYLIHGEPKAKRALRQELSNKGWRVAVPKHGTSIAL